MQSKIYAIPQSIMVGTGASLFDHIAECLANFMKVSLYSFYLRVEFNQFDIKLLMIVVGK